MSAKPDLKTIFGRFVGKTLQDPMRLSCDMDTVLCAMEAEAKKNGLELRVHFPDMMSDCGYIENRANVTAESDGHGKFRVTNKFNLG